jgi:hypothetical protein
MNRSNFETYNWLVEDNASERKSPMMLYENTGRSRRTFALLLEKQAQAYSGLMSFRGILSSQQFNLRLHICNVTALAHGRLQKHHSCCKGLGAPKAHG